GGGRGRRLACARAPRHPVRRRVRAVRRPRSALLAAALRPGRAPVARGGAATVTPALAARAARRAVVEPARCGVARPDRRDRLPAARAVPARTLDRAGRAGRLVGSAVCDSRADTYG